MCLINEVAVLTRISINNVIVNPYIKHNFAPAAGLCFFPWQKGGTGSRIIDHPMTLWESTCFLDH